MSNRKPFYRYTLLRARPEGGVVAGQQFHSLEAASAAADARRDETGCGCCIRDEWDRPVPSLVYFACANTEES